MADSPDRAQSALMPMEPRAFTVLSQSSLSSSTTSMFHGGRTISASGASAISMSRVRRNSVPSPCFDFTFISPPMASTMYLVMAMPRPVPSVLWTRALSSRAKESKICSINSGDMPMPLSCTQSSTLTWSSPLGDGSSFRLTRIRPSSGVNFTAFERRFRSTWFSRTLSVSTFSAEMSIMDTPNSWRFAFTWGCTMLTMLSISSRRDTRS